MAQSLLDPETVGGITLTLYAANPIPGEEYKIDGEDSMFEVNGTLPKSSVKLSQASHFVK